MANPGPDGALTRQTRPCGWPSSPAIQLLPPRQRASLLLCDVLGWSALETAQLLGGSTALGQTAPCSGEALARTLAQALSPAGRPLAAIAAQPAGKCAAGTLYQGPGRPANLDGFIALLREDATPTTCRHGANWYQGTPLRSTVFFKTVWSNFVGYRRRVADAGAQRPGPAVAIYARPPSASRMAAAPSSLHRHRAPPAGGPSPRSRSMSAPLAAELIAAFGLPPMVQERLVRTESVDSSLLTESWAGGLGL